MCPFGFGCGCGSRSSRDREVIREVVVMVPCKYCAALMPQTTTTCPHCGAKRTS